MKIHHTALVTAARYVLDNRPANLSVEKHAEYMALAGALVDAAAHPDGTSSAHFARAERIAKRLEVVL